MSTRDLALDAPRELSDAAHAFVEDMLSTHDFSDAAARLLLYRMAEIKDEIVKCQAVLRENGGRFFKDRFGKPKVHPAAQQETALTNELGKLFRLLGMDQDARGGGKDQQSLWP